MAHKNDDLFSVSGKNVLITGGSRGIGFMIACGFAEAGANIFITSRDGDACRRAAESIRARIQQQKTNNNNKNNDVQIFHGPSNVGTRNGCQELAKLVQNSFSKLDVLINNAGTSWGEEPYNNERSDKESTKHNNWGWDKVLDLNVKGPFYLTRELLPMLERHRTSAPIVVKDDDDDDDDDTMTRRLLPVDDPGRVINIGSIAGFIPQGAPTHAYDVSKAAVHHLTRKMSADLASRGVTVNSVAPGYVPSKMTEGLKSWGIDGDIVSAGIPLGRMGNEHDMVGACIYFSSRAGAWCTGVILPVDGGAVGATVMQLLPSNL